jgi:3-deoxy-D-manno-octulosonic-acid transferase
MYFVYSILVVAFFAVVSPWFVYQALRYRKYIGSLSQRMGYLPLSFNMDGEQSIWIHAVSVGEVLTARPLARDLRARYPRLRVFLSTTTMAGQVVARRSLQEVDEVFYFPFDLPIFVRRTLDLVRPRLFIMMETEIWPNLLRACRKRGVKTAIVNGRLSQRSYPRYRFVRGFMRNVLDDVDAFCVQSEESARRFIDLGANPGRITVTGSLKFDSLDLSPPTIQSRSRDRVLRYFRIPAARPVIVAGSTMKGEEPAVLAAFRRVRSSLPQTLLILAPRHLERVAEVLQLCRQEGFKTTRRSELPIDAEPRVDIVIVDTLGELATIYQLGTVAFVGGSLVATGGHNILEPAVFGKPIVFGPHMSNFSEIAQAFVLNAAGVQVRGERELGDTLTALMTDPIRRARLGAAARALVEANRGAKEKSLTVLASLLPHHHITSFPANVRPFRPIA